MKENEQIDKIKKMAAKNRAAALTLAVVFTLGATLPGCSSNRNDEEDDDDYVSGGGGGSYFYSSGSSYRSGSWSKAAASGVSKSGYSSVRGGSIGG